MSKKHFSILLAVFTTGAMYGQDSTKVATLDEVVITASKFPQKQNTTGKVITVINKEQLEKSSAKTVGQLLNEQTGIHIAGALNNLGGNQTVFMRGSSIGRTLILLDGIPVSDPSLIYGEFDLNLFSLSNVERIEICKGAQSTLYGSDAIAGVINIITVRQGVQKPLNLTSTITGGSFGTLKGNVQVYGKKNNLTYSARYAKIIAKGFSAAHDSTGTKSFDKDAYDGDVANAQLLWQASKKLSLKTFVLYSRYKADIDLSVFTDEKDYATTNKSFTTGAGFTFKHDFLTLTGNYQYSDIARIYRNDSAFKSSTIFENNEYFGKTQFVELYAAVRLGHGFTLLQGADFRYASYNQHYFSISGFGPFSNTFPDTSLNQSGLYTSLNYAGPNNKFNMELGGRLNNHSRYGSTATYTFNPSYAFNKNIRVFGSISSGFKAPSLFQLSNNRDLLAEKSVNYEAGVQLQRNIFNTRLIYFRRHINNGIDYNYITFNYFNYIKQITEGLEFEATVKPIEKLNITAGYAYLSPRETTQNRQTNKDTIIYHYLIRRPKHNIHTNIGLQATRALYISLNAKHVSKRYDVGGFKKADIKMDYYSLLGAYAEYRFSKTFKLFGDAQNITGERFFDIRGYNSIPRMFTMGVNVDL